MVNQAKPRSFNTAPRLWGPKNIWARCTSHSAWLIGKINCWWPPYRLPSKNNWLRSSKSTRILVGSIHRRTKQPRNMGDRLFYVYLGNPYFWEGIHHCWPTIQQAWMTLRSSDAWWQESYADCISELGFFQFKSDPAICMLWPGDICEYVAAYNDDLAMETKNPE